MERSPVNSLEIKHLLKNALTNKIQDKQVYMRGIQQSYMISFLILLAVGIIFAAVAIFVVKKRKEEYHK